MLETYSGQLNLFAYLIYFLDTFQVPNGQNLVSGSIKKQKNELYICFRHYATQAVNVWKFVNS